MIRVDRLIWDEGNISHIARHKVTPQEVEEVCHGRFLVLDARYGRLLLIGLTKKGRSIAIILDPELKEGVYYPVTARSADRRERSKYAEEMEVKI